MQDHYSCLPTGAPVIVRGLENCVRDITSLTGARLSNRNTLQKTIDEMIYNRIWRQQQRKLKNQRSFVDWKCQVNYVMRQRSKL